MQAIVTPSSQPEEYYAVDLRLAAESVGPEATCGQVFDLLVRNESWPGVAVVQRDGTVLGLVDRTTLLMTFAQPLLRDLFDRRPIARLMDPDPLMVEETADLASISNRIRDEKPEALARGFVITRNGRYSGVGTSLRLMTMIADQASHRSAMLEEARHAAEAASRAKTRFLANISHELRTPLNVVIGFAELLQSEFLGPLGNDRYREYVEDIGSSGRHLLELINDLLDLAKAEANRMTLAESLVDFQALAASSFRLIRERAQAAGITLVLDVPEPLPPVMADECRIRQVLLNLVSNATKFTPPGGRVTLSAGLDPEGRLWAEVHDTGIGMSKEEIATAMEPFAQIDNFLSRRHQGTGLGLPLTRRLIELHGGTMSIVSAPGEGTRVAFTLPADRLCLPGPAAVATG